MPVDEISILAKRFVDDTNNYPDICGPDVCGSDKLEYTDKDNIEKLIIATLKLYVQPGKNPHNGKGTTNLKFLAVQTPSLINSYWWTSPNLISDTDGAKVVTCWQTQIIYMSSEIHAEQIDQIDSENAGEAYDAHGEDRPPKKKVTIGAYIHPDYQAYVDISNLSQTEVELYHQ